MNRHPAQPVSRQHGIGLIEMMVSVAIALFLLGGMIYLVVGGSRSYAIMNGSARMQENGRYAMLFLARDLRMAGYFGCAHRTPGQNMTVTPGSLYDIANAIEGLNNTTGTGKWQPSGFVNTIAGLRSNSDAVTIRFSNPSATAAVQTNMANPSAAVVADTGGSNHQFGVGDIVTISDCENADVFRVTNVTNGTNTLAHSSTAQQSGPSNASASLGESYLADAEVQRLRAVRYYIKGSDPALFRQSIVAGSGIEEQKLVDGVEAMRILYGEDTSGDGRPNGYFGAVAYTDSSTGATTPAVTNWANVVSVRIALLLRTTTEYGGNKTDVDKSTYPLLDKTIDPPNLRVNRRVTETTVRIRNR